jgi:multiple sugar transport system permease protein
LKKSHVGAFVLLVVLAALSLFPTFWLIAQSFKNPRDAIAVPPKIIFTPTKANYLTLFKDPLFITSTLNSFMVTGISIPIVLGIGVPAAYALARFKFRGSNDLGFYVFSTLVLPPITILVPFMRLFTLYHISNSWIGMIITHFLLNIGIVIWIMRSFFIGIPKSLEDAARIDGCTLWKAFLHIGIPAATSGLATVLVISFIFSWNDLIFALILTSPSNTTLPLYLPIANQTFYKMNWGGLSATGVLMVIPNLILLYIIRKHLARAFSLGAIG